MVSIEKKKNFIINIFYTAIVILLFYAFFKYAFGLFLPFIVAVFVAMILQKPINFVCEKTKIKKGFVSVFFVIICSLLILSAISLIIIWIGTEVKGFVQYLIMKLDDVPAFINDVENFVRHSLAFLPDKAETPIVSFITDKLQGFLAPSGSSQNTSAGFDLSMLSTPLSGVWNTAKQIPTTLVSIVIAVVACCFMSTDFLTVKRVFLSLFKKETREKVVRTKRLLFPALAKMAKAYALIITITFSELSLGLFILKLLGIYDGGFIFIIAGIIALIDIVPVLGTGTVLVPWALVSLLTGNIPLAIGITIMYVCITVIRQIIEPKLVAAQLGIPAFATIIAMYIGSRIFGFIGLFLLPITIVMVKMLNDEGIIHVFHKVEDFEFTGQNEEITDEKKDD